MWDNKPIKDDPVVGTNTRGVLTFAMRGACVAYIYRFTAELRS